jgi:predicted Fe-Mo cluster-binding NifX family protein
MRYLTETAVSHAARSNVQYAEQRCKARSAWRIDILKVAISSTGPNLDSQVDPRFGRCVYFLIVDVATGKVQAVENSAAGFGGGAGIQAAQTIVDHKAEIVLTGDVGPNAFRVLAGAGIKVITGISGTCEEALQKFKDGAFKPVTAPSVVGHHGMGSGRRGFSGRRGR